MSIYGMKKTKLNGIFSGSCVSVDRHPPLSRSRPKHAYHMSSKPVVADLHMTLSVPFLRHNTVIVVVYKEGKRIFFAEIGAL